MDEEYPNHDEKGLFAAVLRLASADEAARFFRDLLTVGEIKEFSNRWKMAKLIDKGISYQRIAQEIGCSTATVTRTAHWLNHGMGGYRLILEKTKKNEQ